MGLEGWPLVGGVANAAAVAIIVELVLPLSDLILGLLEHLNAPLYVLVAMTSDMFGRLVTQGADWLKAFQRLAVEVEVLIDGARVPIDVFVAVMEFAVIAARRFTDVPLTALR